MNVLLIEDNLGDARLVAEGLKHGPARHHLDVMGDGVEALAFLHQYGTYSTAQRPDLIVLDLNLPRKNGREVLAEIKTDPTLRTIPVVVFSGSHADVDILASYGLQANCYVSKPIDLDQFLAAVRSIEDFWLSTALLPSQSGR
jgi:two-component system, chemotaxis family, response regulator Rcp1